MQSAGWAMQRRYAAIARLVPWKGSAEELERMPFPLLDTVASVGARVTQQADEERRGEDALAEANGVARAIEDDLKLLAAADEIPTAEAIATARQARDISWGRIRESGLAGKCLVETDAAAHGELVQRADHLVDRHVQHRELPTLLRNRARALTAVEEYAESLRRTQARKAEEWSRWRGLWADTGWDPQAVGDVEAMKAWLDRVKEAKLAASAVRAAAEVLAEAKIHERLAREAVCQAAELYGDRDHGGAGGILLKARARDCLGLRHEHHRAEQRANRANSKALGRTAEPEGHPNRRVDQNAAGEKSGGWAWRAAGRRRDGRIDRARRGQRDDGARVTLRHNSRNA
jgi:hypothetical protein